MLDLFTCDFTHIVNSHNEPCEIMIKSRLQSNTTRAISVLVYETRVEISALNKIKEYM